MLCSTVNPNFAGWLDAPATITPRGSNSARKPSASTPSLIGGPSFGWPTNSTVRPGWRRAKRDTWARSPSARSLDLHQRVDRHRDAAGNDEGVEVDGAN